MIIGDGLQLNILLILLKFQLQSILDFVERNFYSGQMIKNKGRIVCEI